MKTQITKAILLWLAAITLAQADSVTELHVGVSPFLRSAERQMLVQQFPALVLDPAQLPGGARVVVWDGWRLMIVAEFNIPNLKFDSQQARAPKLIQPLATLGQWLRSAPLHDSTIPADLPALKAPELLELISRRSAPAHRSILLLGSPLYLSLTEPTFSMTDGRYPADAHLRTTLEESVYGLADKSNRLGLTTVHWSYFQENFWLTELHRSAVTRFWGMFVQGQNGSLATFGADLSSALANCTRTGLPPCGKFVPDPASEKLEMRTAAPRSIPLWLRNTRPPAPPLSARPAASPQPETPPVRSQIEPPSTPEPPAPTPVAEPIPTALAVPAPVVMTPPPVSTPVPAAMNPLPIQPVVGKVGIGIAWAAEGVDLDLYVQTAPGTRDLYYRHTASKDGRYFHDYRNRNQDLDYEYVELSQSIDLHQLKAWVNFYTGRASNVTGKVCVNHNGRTYVGDFALAAGRGNHGGDLNSRASSPYWVELDLVQVAGLGSSPSQP